MPRDIADSVSPPPGGRGRALAHERRHQDDPRGVLRESVATPPPQRVASGVGPSSAHVGDQDLLDDVHDTVPRCGSQGHLADVRLGVVADRRGVAGADRPGRWPVAVALQQGGKEHGEEVLGVGVVVVGVGREQAPSDTRDVVDTGVSKSEADVQDGGLLGDVERRRVLTE